MSDWQEIGGGENGDMWDRKGSIEGTYLRKQSNVGPNDSMVYTLKTDKGETGIWGSTVLDTKFEQIETGSQVRVEYLGKSQSKSGRGEYHDYKVMVKPVEEEATTQTQTDAKNVQDVLGGEII